jgi:lactoylglutathione lyase
MHLGYAIIYVPDVGATVEFYEMAFGLKRRFIHESGLYAEMETGSTALAFAAEAMAELGELAIRPNRAKDVAAGFEIAFVTDDPHLAFERAVHAGATSLKPPVLKPWGQIVGYVRDRNGCMVEICSPVSAG